MRGVAELGYALSSEEHGPRQLVRNAQRAEACGFSFAMISDHFRPWVDRLRAEMGTRRMFECAPRS